MRLTPRAKLLLVAALFLAPIVASVLAYNFMHLAPTANYGELILPPASIPSQRFDRPDGSAFAFGDLAGRWVLVASDSGDCGSACLEKLITMRQLRLALGRDAARVERVLVVDDARPTAASIGEAFPGMHVVRAPRGVQAPAGATHDRAHIYLMDPNGNVMMRWPGAPDARGMLKDLQRLLKASQIG